MFNNKAQINTACIRLLRACDNKAHQSRGARRLSVQVTHKKIFNLEPETNYIAFVTAVTSAGAGPRLSVTARTRHYARLYIHCCRLTNK